MKSLRERKPRQIQSAEKVSRPGKIKKQASQKKKPQAKKEVKAKKSQDKIDDKQKEEIKIEEEVVNHKPQFDKYLEKNNWPTEDQLKAQVDTFIEQIKNEPVNPLTKQELELIFQVMDLTSLGSTDGPAFIDSWLEKQLIDTQKTHQNLYPAAICVYPNFTKQVKDKIKAASLNDKVKTAVVTTCFPTGQTFLEVKVLETKMAVEQGADEIDMVVSRGQWKEKQEEFVFKEIFQVKHACGKTAHLKVILENCEIENYAQIYKLSYMSLVAGGDFIKTSTGKGTHGAKLEHFIVMLLALSQFSNDYKDNARGIKAAGGVQTFQDAYKYIKLGQLIIKNVTPQNFRIGASSLAKSIITEYTK